MERRRHWRLPKYRSSSVGRFIYLLTLLFASVTSHFGGAFRIPAYATRTDRSAHCSKHTRMTKRMASGTPDVPKGDDEALPDSPVQRKTWNPWRLAILRLGFTEPAMTSPLNYGKYDDGTFRCAYCHHALFDANAKYNSGTGWPSFWRSSSADAVALRREWDGRLECRCAKCQSHLGHVFLDGPRPAEVDPVTLRTAPDTDPRSSSSSNRLPRYCINGGALTYESRRQRIKPTNRSDT